MSLLLITADLDESEEAFIISDGEESQLLHDSDLCGSDVDTDYLISTDTEPDSPQHRVNNKKKKKKRLFSDKLLKKSISWKAAASSEDNKQFGDGACQAIEETEMHGIYLL